MRRFRLLPAMIFLATLTLTVKLGGLWQNVEVAMFPAAVAEATDGPGDRQAGKTDKMEIGGAGTKSLEVAKASSSDGKSAAEAGDQGRSKEAVSDLQASKDFDPSAATDAEINVLQRLASRRDELDERGRQIDLRDTMLRATERRIDSKIAELGKLKAIVEGLLKQHDAEKEAKLRKLVKIYQNMKPKDAARIFERLDMGILLDVIERMRESKTAPIMANMTPAKAKEVTTALAQRRSLPIPRESAAN